ncbi:hypothetical protein [Actinoplanes regularis]|uniref:Uncharacterized protein n=1 Tax=Actinoplanes regularis TaxID=52697 RepID=A0A239C797_9ACTN|nr:hypothetical protein [Actinoplanes regularis]GIE92308.1 hypothetical protein Are01nite_87880 [Actinoplanes regularis]SNS15819.1 hypothetical protein SAMN06264365_11113 [Actinoplanes regularis]
MPKVVDAARVTTRDNTVWRTCTGCSLLKPLPDDVDRCGVCDSSRPRTPGEAGWDIAYRYAALVGRIDAWAVQIPCVSDAERLDHIRQLLKTRNPLRKDEGAK